MIHFKTYLNTSDTKCSLQILSHSERHFLRDSQSVTLFKAHVVVNVNDLIKKIIRWAPKCKGII